MPGMACRALSEDEVVKVYNALTGVNAKRNRAMFVFGLYTGFRIGEILSAKVSDVINPEGFNDEITIKETKTGKMRTVKMSEQIKIILKQWIEERMGKGLMLYTDFLFCKSSGARLPYTQAWKVLKAAYFKAGVRGRVATHTMRKTFAIRMLELFSDEARPGDSWNVLKETQKATGHASLKSLEHYLPDSEQKTLAAEEKYGSKIIIGG